MTSELESFLTSLAEVDVLVEAADYREDFETRIPRTVLPSQAKTLCDFASRQHAHWRARYLFSLATDPDIVAEQEVVDWQAHWVLCRDVLVAVAPDLDELLQRSFDLQSQRQVTDTRVEYNKSHPLDWLLVFGVYEPLCSLSGSIGMIAMARFFKARGMYPVGTVGRLDQWI